MVKNTFFQALLQFLDKGKTDHISHAQTPHAHQHGLPALPTTLSSTTLHTQIQTHKAHLCKQHQNGTRCRDGVRT